MSNKTPSRVFAIIGQKIAKARLLASLYASEGKILASPAITGAAGLGKTETALAYGRDMAEKLGCDFTVVHSPTDIRNSESDEYLNLKNVLLSDREEVIFIDEFHKFDEKPTVSMTRVQGFLLKAMDGQNKGRSIPYSADEYTVFDRSKKVVIIATNYREKINPALLSRMDDIILEAYSDAELQAIAIKMLADNELIADNELTIEILAKASRGTARPLFNLVTHLTRKDIPDNTVTIHDAVQAMAELNQYPFGLNRDEVTLLDKAKKSYSRNIAVIALTSLEKCYNKTISYLETRGLLAIQSNGDVLTTKKGKAYLAKLSELGFNV